MPALGVWGLGVFGAVSAPEGLASEVVTSGVVTPITQILSGVAIGCDGY